jgi:ankyrin repeat protein
MPEPKPADLLKLMIKAAKTGNAAAVRTLAETDRTTLDARDSDGSTQLHCASWKVHAEVVALLLDLGADVNARNENTHWGDSPLHAAAHGNQRAVAEILIQNGADIHALNPAGNTPLKETEVHKATAVAKLLRQHGAE